MSFYKSAAIQRQSFAYTNELNQARLDKPMMVTTGAITAKHADVFSMLQHGSQLT